MDVSIVVCTRNQHKSLGRLLGSVDSQHVPENVSWELVVVDNGSTDDTGRVVAEFVKCGKGNARLVHERRRGKSFALNRGVAASSGKIIAFTDDDVILGENWLEILSAEFVRDRELQGLGGRVELYDNLDLPIAVRLSRERKRIRYDEFDAQYIPIIGANWAFRRAIVDRLGGFDTNLGPGSAIGAVAEDVDFLYRALKADAKVLYSPDVIVYHNHGRRTETESSAAMHGYVVGRGAFYAKHVRRGDRFVQRLALREGYETVRDLVGRIPNRRRFLKNAHMLAWLGVGMFRWFRQQGRRDLRRVQRVAELQ
jgi:glycosyltransferase involved in cell wall biosynthesis